jgi:hypothetical protein
MGMILSKVISGVSSLAFIVIAVIAAIAAFYASKGKVILSKKNRTDAEVDDAESDIKKSFIYSLSTVGIAALMAIASALILIV